MKNFTPGQMTVFKSNYALPSLSGKLATVKERHPAISDGENFSDEFILIEFIDGSGIIPARTHELLAIN